MHISSQTEFSGRSLVGRREVRLSAFRNLLINLPLTVTTWRDAIIEPRREIRLSLLLDVNALFIISSTKISVSTSSWQITGQIICSKVMQRVESGTATSISFLKIEAIRSLAFSPSISTARTWLLRPDNQGDRYAKLNGRCCKGKLSQPTKNSFMKSAVS